MAATNCLDRDTCQFCTAQRIGRNAWRIVYVGGRVEIVLVDYLPDRYEPQ